MSLELLEENALRQNSLGYPGVDFRWMTKVGSKIIWRRSADNLPWKEVKPKASKGEKTKDGRYLYRGATTPDFYDAESQDSSHNPYSTSIPSADPYLMYGPTDRYAYTNEMFYDNVPYSPAAYKSGGNYVKHRPALSDQSSSDFTGSTFSRRKPCIALAVALAVLVVLILIGVGVYFGIHLIL
ncbi:uncharacterized protein LOC117338966 [Pecten maximus]|uniref:uncharacterized protein LOC117338966 n=1 Tax=Pecten maximus TaxID=6579 RepID=UPI001458257C|nr:uncharacterized protein LOC117338966 [Pecten maximus]